MAMRGTSETLHSCAPNPLPFLLVLLAGCPQLLCGAAPAPPAAKNDICTLAVEHAREGVCKCSAPATSSGVFHLTCERTTIGNVSALLSSLQQQGKSGGSVVRLDKVSVRNCIGAAGVIEPLPRLHVRSLEIANCAIGGFHERVFDSLAETLRELAFVNATLSVIPPLGALPRLHSLNLNRNHIRDVPERAFDTLKRLRQLRLRGNRIVTLPPNALNETKSTLELLDLADNALRAIPAQSLRNSMALSYLSLAGNEIQEVAQMQFMNLPKLAELRLERNHLTQISPVGLMNVPALRQLHLRGNALTTLDMGNLQVFKQLELIDLGENRFSKIPSMKELPRLVEVRIDHNSVGRIDTLTFSANPRLRVIKLHDNHIASISRNSFDSLDSLTTLLLGNNRLSALERSMFDGMRALKRLHLRNNSIAELANNTFASIPSVAVADLSANRLSRIPHGTFAQLTKLHLLDLSDNELVSIEHGAFQSRVAQIFLEGNRLDCDGDAFSSFVDYLVRNKVRTFLTNQAEITCASPGALAGTRLRDIMMKRANETLATASSAGNDASQQPGADILSRLLPQLGIGGVTKGGSNAAAGAGSARPVNVQALDGQQLGSTDIQQLLRTLPSMVINVPGLGQIDVSKLPPSLLEHVLKGGHVPGVSREAIDSILKQYTERLKLLAAQGNQPPRIGGDGGTEVISALPEGVDSLQRPTHARPTTGQAESGAAPMVPWVPGELISSGSPNLTEIFSPKVLAMMRLLPPGFNYSKLSPEIMKTVMAGEMPDLSQLPPELQDHIKQNLDHIFTSLSVTPDVNIDDILRKLPKFELPTLHTFSPYDINRVDTELIVNNQKDAKLTRLYTAAALSVIGLASIAILSLVFWRLRKQRRREDNQASVKPQGSEEMGEQRIDRTGRGGYFNQPLPHSEEQTVSQKPVLSSQSIGNVKHCQATSIGQQIAMNWASEEALNTSQQKVSIGGHASNKPNLGRSQSIAGWNSGAAVSTSQQRVAIGGREASGFGWEGAPQSTTGWQAGGPGTSELSRGRPQSIAGWHPGGGGTNEPGGWSASNPVSTSQQQVVIGAREASGSGWQGAPQSTARWQPGGTGTSELSRGRPQSIAGWQAGGNGASEPVGWSASNPVASTSQQQEMNGGRGVIGIGRGGGPRSSAGWQTGTRGAIQHIGREGPRQQVVTTVLGASEPVGWSTSNPAASTPQQQVVTGGREASGSGWQGAPRSTTAPWQTSGPGTSELNRGRPQSIAGGQNGGGGTNKPGGWSDSNPAASTSQQQAMSGGREASGSGWQGAPQSTAPWQTGGPGTNERGGWSASNQAVSTSQQQVVIGGREASGSGWQEAPQSTAPWQTGGPGTSELSRGRPQSIAGWQAGGGGTNELSGWSASNPVASTSQQQGTSGGRGAIGIGRGGGPRSSAGWQTGTRGAIQPSGGEGLRQQVLAVLGASEPGGWSTSNPAASTSQQQVAIGGREASGSGWQGAPQSQWQTGGPGTNELSRGRPQSIAGWHTGGRGTNEPSGWSAGNPGASTSQQRAMTAGHGASGPGWQGAPQSTAGWQTGGPGTSEFSHGRPQSIAGWQTGGGGTNEPSGWSASNPGASTSQQQAMTGEHGASGPGWGGAPQSTAGWQTGEHGASEPGGGGGPQSTTGWKTTGGSGWC